MTDKYISINSKTKNVQFLIRISSEAEQYFKSAIADKHYLFSKDLLILKANLVREGQGEDFEVHLVSSEGLKGLVKRISLKKYISDDVDDLVVLYFPATNSFVLKETNGEISHSFDYFRLV